MNSDLLKKKKKKKLFLKNYLQFIFNINVYKQDLILNNL